MASFPMCHYLVETKKAYQKSLDDTKTVNSRSEEIKSTTGQTGKHLQIGSAGESLKPKSLPLSTANQGTVSENILSKESDNAIADDSTSLTSTENSNHSHMNCPFLKRVQDILASLDKSENDRTPQRINSNGKGLNMVSNVSQEKAETDDAIFGLNCQFLNPASNKVSDKPCLTNKDQDRKPNDKQSERNENLERSFVEPDKQTGDQTKDITSTKTNNIKFAECSSKYTSLLAKDEVRTNKFLPKVIKASSSMKDSYSGHQHNKGESPTLHQNPSQGENKVKILCESLDREENQHLNKNENQNVNTENSVRTEAKKATNDPKCITEASVDETKSSNQTCSYLEDNKSSSTSVKCVFLKDIGNLNTSQKEPPNEVSKNIADGDKTGLTEDKKSDTKPLLEEQESSSHHVCNYLQSKTGYKGVFKCEYLQGNTSDDPKTNTSDETKNPDKSSTANASSQMEKLPKEVSEMPSTHKCNYLDMSKDSNGKITCALLEKTDKVLSSEKGDSDAANRCKGISKGNMLKQDSQSMAKSSDKSDMSIPQHSNYVNKIENSNVSSSLLQKNDLEGLQVKEPVVNSDRNPIKMDKTDFKQDSHVNGTELYNVSHNVISPRFTKMSCEYLNADKSQMVSTRHVCEYLKNSSDGDVKSESVKYTEKDINGEQKLYGLEKVNYNSSAKSEGSQSVAYNQVGWNENKSQQSGHHENSNPILQVRQPVYEVPTNMIGEMKINYYTGTALVSKYPGITNEHSLASPDVKPKFHYSEVPPNFGITKGTAASLSSTNSTIQPFARFSSVVSRKAVNASYKNFLLRLPKCNSNELPDNISQWGNIKTNRIVHAASSFTIWNYVDKRGKRRGNISSFNYSRFKKQGYALATPVQRGEKQTKSNFMETSSEARIGDQFKKPSFTSTPRSKDEVFMNSKSKGESLENKMITKKKTKRRTKSSKSHEGANDQCNSSDIDDLQENDRELLNSISPNSNSPRLNDLGLLGGS